MWDWVSETRKNRRIWKNDKLIEKLVNAALGLALISKCEPYFKIDILYGVIIWDIWDMRISYAAYERFQNGPRSVDDSIYWYLSLSWYDGRTVILGFDPSVVLAKKMIWFAFIFMTS